MEKWFYEFESASPLVQSLVVAGFREYAQGLSDEEDPNHKEKRTAAAYQLAIYYANSSVLPFNQMNV